MHRATSPWAEDRDQEEEDPCLLGTPVCLPAIVWFEDEDGEHYKQGRFFCKC